MKQWIFTIALSISLVCGQLEAAAGEYTIQKEQTGGTGQEQAGQGQAVQEQAGQGQAVQKQAGQGQAVQTQAGQEQAGQKQAGQEQAARTENADFLKLYAQSAVLMDGSSGRILYGKGQDIIRPMASTTKS
ncbi:MAG: hypothetical protein ACLRTG_23025 [Enterocloster aldenensis]